MLSWYYHQFIDILDIFKCFVVFFNINAHTIFKVYLKLDNQF